MALIVTIVVLIILAGVSISAISGENGLISKSKKARDEAEKMQNSTAQNREALYGEIVGKKDQYEESGTVGISLELEKKSDTSITAIADATDTKSEIISYTFYIKKITENDSAYVTIKKSDKLTNIATCSNLEKDMGYKVKVVAMNKEGVSKTAEKKIVLGDAIKISVTPLSGPDSYPSTVSVKATSVTSNMDYIKLPNGEKVYAKNGKFNIKTTYNSTKNGPIIFTAYDKDGNAGLLEYDEQNVINFETEWTFAEANTEITVPVTGTVDLYIDYGDGTKENITTANPTHTYETPGKYTMKISGKCDRYTFNTSTRDYLTGLKKWGCLENKSYAFGGRIEGDSWWSGCANINGNIPEPYEKSFRLMTDASNLFKGCTNLTGSIPENLFRNCQNLTSLNCAFYYCSKLTGQIPNRLFYDCINVVNCGQIFNSCSGLTGEIPEDLFSNCKQARNFDWLFAQCKNLGGKIPENLFKYCTEAKNFYYVFTGVAFSGDIPEKLFSSCTKAIEFTGIFDSCTGVTGEIPNNLFINCPEATSFDYTFSKCNKLSGNIPSGLFSNNSNVKSFRYTFKGCSGLNGNIPEGIFDSCVNVTNFSGTFNGCSKITGIPAGIFSKCTKVTTFANTFSGCNQISGNIPNDVFKNCSEVTDFSNTFLNCKFTGEIPENLFCDAYNVTNFTGTFEGCKIDKIPEKLFYNNKKVTSFERTFFYNSIATIPENLFKYCTNVTSFSGTFGGCGNLINIPSTLFDNCSQVINFGSKVNDGISFNINMGTFAGCTSLIGNAPELWTRDNVQNSYYCFRGCSKLNNYADIPDNWK